MSGQMIRIAFVPYSLIELAAIQIGRRLYSQQAVKEFIKDGKKQVEASCEEDTYPVMDDYVTYLYEKDDNVIYQLIKGLDIPTTLEEKLTEIAELMAWMMWDWLLWIDGYEEGRVGLDNYIDHMQFLYDGRVDDCNVIHSMYASKVFPENANTFLFLCKFCIEDAIIDLWPRVEHLQPFERPTAVLYYWICRLKQCVGCDECCNENFNSAEILFNVALFNGFHSACKYLWARLDDDSQKRSMCNVSRMFEELTTYGIPRHLDTLIFAWQRLQNPWGAYMMLASMIQIDWMLERLTNWPWDKLFVNTIRQSWDMFDSADCAFFLNAISSAMNESINELPNRMEFERVLHELWNKCTADCKKSMAFDNIFYVLHQEMSILEIFINDPILKERRPELLIQLVNIVRDESPSESAFSSSMTTLLNTFALTTQERELIESVMVW